MSTFKRCPFCGEKWNLDFNTTQFSGKKFIYVICLTCDAKGPASELDNTTAIINWNLRYPEDADEEEN